MRFEIDIEGKKLIFDSELAGLKAGGKEFLSGRNGTLIYDRAVELRTGEVELQMSTNRRWVFFQSLGTV